MSDPLMLVRCSVTYEPEERRGEEGEPCSLRAAAVLLAAHVLLRAKGARLVAVVARAAAEVRQGTTALHRLEHAHERTLETTVECRVVEDRLAGRRAAPRDELETVGGRTRVRESLSEPLPSDVLTESRTTQSRLDAVDALVESVADQTRDLALGVGLLLALDDVDDEGFEDGIRGHVFTCFSVLLLL